MVLYKNGVQVAVAKELAPAVSGGNGAYTAKFDVTEAGQYLVVQCQDVVYAPKMTNRDGSRML